MLEGLEFGALLANEGAGGGKGVSRLPGEPLGVADLMKGGAG